MSNEYPPPGDSTPSWGPPPPSQDPNNPAWGAPPPGQGPGGPAWGPPPPAQGPGGPGWGAPMNKPDNNLIWAILCTLCCCLPFGIASIVFAAKVDGLWNSGQYAEAQKAADDAKKWAIIGAVAGLLGSVAYVIFMFAIGAGSTTSGY